MNILRNDWLIAAIKRALKTMAQTALGMMTIGMAASDIDWIHVLSVSCVAGLYSLVSSIAGLPEVPTDGVLQVDVSDPSIDKYNLVLETPLEDVNNMKVIHLKVDNHPR